MEIPERTAAERAARTILFEMEELTGLQHEEAVERITTIIIDMYKKQSAGGLEGK
jgi:hypothetical protein